MEHKSTIEILKDLVGFDTVSERSNLELISYVEKYLQSYGVSSTLIPNAEGTKASLFATIGPICSGGVILSGHTDVVPVEGQNWSANPFELKLNHDRAYGRGSVDMKGFLASVLSAVPKFNSMKLNVPIHLAFSYDEEVGCAGVAPLIQHILDQGIDASACIVGEPTKMEIVSAHTGKQVFECTFKGTPMHSSLAPSGVNAITSASKVVSWLADLAQELESQRTADDRFAYTHPTINVGYIVGGKAINIVAEDCRFLVEYRYPPGINPSLMQEELPSFIKRNFGAGTKVETAGGSATCSEIIAYPSFSAEGVSSAVSLVASVVDDQDRLIINYANSLQAVNFGTEAGLFSQAGIPTVVIGPGEIAQAHQPDEYIQLNQLKKCDDFIKGIARLLSEKVNA